MSGTVCIHTYPQRMKACQPLNSISTKLRKINKLVSTKHNYYHTECPLKPCTLTDSTTTTLHIVWTHTCSEVRQLLVHLVKLLQRGVPDEGADQLGLPEQTQAQCGQRAHRDGLVVETQGKGVRLHASQTSRLHERGEREEQSHVCMYIHISQGRDSLHHYHTRQLYYLTTGAS